MFYDKTKIHYEVLAWPNPEGLGMEEVHEAPIPRKADAIKMGRAQARAYKRVEVIAVKVDANDPNNLLEDKLIAAWTNGKKTA